MKYYGILLLLLCVGNVNTGISLSKFSKFKHEMTAIELSKHNTRNMTYYDVPILGIVRSGQSSPDLFYGSFKPGLYTCLGNQTAAVAACKLYTSQK